MVRVLAIAQAAVLTAANISPTVLRDLEVSGAANVVVYFHGENPDSLVKSELTGTARRTTLVDALISQSQSSKSVIEAILGPRPESINEELFYIDNTFQPDVPLTAEQIEKFANHPSVALVSTPVVADLFPIEETEVIQDNNTTAANQWGVEIIQAPKVWSKGNKGRGIVVANIDTGVRVSHKAVKSNWRKEFGWFDPEGKSSSPKDYQGHGSHTIGTIVGKDGVGVAPEAKWVACVGCTSSGCPQKALTACAQWLLCPSNSEGARDCSKAPNVINNSWGSNNGQANWFEPSIKAWRAGGIIPVFSNGNNGRNGCGTVGSPGSSPLVIGVGASDSQDALADFSSRGPTYDQRIKPDVAAPGKNVLSIDWKSDTGLKSLSGTSMAAPHVAGAVALYLSNNKGATYDEILKAFTSSADTEGLTPDEEDCGDISDSTYPNNNYGHGRLNIASAIYGQNDD